MSATLVNLQGFERLAARFTRIANPDPIPLLVTFERLIEEDNRKGVLDGTDKDGKLMDRPIYRPKAGKIQELSAQQRMNQRKRAKRGMFAGLGPWASGLHNNLTTEEYEMLDGPPLAPRRQFSRVITNLRLEPFERNQISGGWEFVASARWVDVVSVEGVHFLTFHFNGEGQKRRDLRGVRPKSLEKARKSARAWMIDQIRSEQV